MVGTGGHDLVLARRMSVWRQTRKFAAAFGPWIAGALLLIGCCLAWLLLPLADWLRSFSEWVQQFGVAGVLAFSFAYLLGVVVLVPSSPMSLAAGLAYGWWGIPIVLVVETTGATVSFLISRYLLRKKVRAATSKRPLARATVQAVNAEGWKTVVLLRLSPILPFNAQSYLLGATDIPLVPYVAATTAGILPGTIVAVYLGVLGIAVGQEGVSPISLVLLVLGLTATVVVTVLVTIKARARLQAGDVKKKSSG